VTSPEFTDWIAFDRLSPLPETRIDIAGATICATVANAALATDRFTAADFLPDWHRPYRDPATDHGQLTTDSEEDVAEKCRAFFGRFRAPPIVNSESPKSE